jgi:hypothetical protein
MSIDGVLRLVLSNTKTHCSTYIGIFITEEKRKEILEVVFL